MAGRSRDGLAGDVGTHPRVPRRALHGGIFKKDVIDNEPKSPDAALAPKAEPAGNRFGRPMLGPPKDDPMTLTMSYKEHSIGKLTTSIPTAGKYKIEVNLKAAEQFVDNVFDYNRCKMTSKSTMRCL